MKIQYKASFIMTVFGLVIVLLLTWGYGILSHKTVIDKELQNIQNISEEVSLHLESKLAELTTVGLTLSSAPLIKNALLKSNSQFSVLSDKERKQEISTRNQQWKKITDINDPFIKTHITNPVAELLKTQQIILPDRYGEIFLTNIYGVMISTTGKLTTLAHAHKYWWQASFDDGHGRIFLDDRGFDTSVDGYVLGVVIPVKIKGEIIGILKCNVNIMSSLSDITNSFSLSHIGKLQIVRTGGLIVSQKDVVPLTQKINKDLIKLLQKKQDGTAIIAENNENQLVAYTSIGITMGSEKFAFGGSQASVDHIKGNKGEGWHIIVSLSEEKMIAESHNTTLVIIVVGIAMTLLSALVALFLGKLAARPIIKLSSAAKSLGEGHLDTRADIFSNDEIGSLSLSLNKMAQNFQSTMISRDELSNEVEIRTAESEKAKLIAENANRAKGIFIANMSHEFHTPLNAVLGFSQEMLEDQTLSAKYRDYLNIINCNGRLQLNLINDVLAMSNLESGQASLKPEAFELSKLIENIVDKGQFSAKAKKITFNVEYRSKLPQFIICDYEKLQQILSTIINNAIKYTDSGAVSVRMDSEPVENSDYVELSFDIEDSGIGIAEEFRNHIFQPFAQIDGQNNKTGTGLGLTLAKRFVELMGGKISLESESGRGTIFHISLRVKLASKAVFEPDKLPNCDIIGVFETKNKNLQLTSVDLDRLAKETLSELTDAVFALDVEHVREVIKHIEVQFPELADILVTMVDNLDFKTLQAVLNNRRG